MATLGDEISTSTDVSPATFGSGRRRKETSYSDDLSSYTVPKCTEQHAELLEKYCAMFHVSSEVLKRINITFQDELRKGLECHKKHPETWVESECSFKMLDSCVEKLPTGTEKGVYYALDFGGTHFRAVRVSLEGNGHVKCTQAKFSLKYEGPSGHHKGLLDSKSTATMLFDHFAERVKTVMDKSGDLVAARKIPIGVGFTFSFPCKQTALQHSTLVEWTKGFETGRATNDPVEQRDVGLLMSQAFDRNDVPATLSAIANDTVGTLLSCAYQKPPGTPPCLVGVILGTGMNGCYVEPSSAQYGYKGQVINIECGNFSRDLPLTEIDAQVDWQTSNRGRQLLEKLISGAYLGELIRHTYIRIFRNRAPPRAWTAETLSTEDCAVIVNDKTADLGLSFKRVQSKWDANFCHEDLVDLQRICRVLFDRSAALAGMSICAMCAQTGQLFPTSDGITVAVDGSLYVKNPWFSHRVRVHMTSIVGEELSDKIHLLAADDGSGQGAAILAAANS